MRRLVPSVLVALACALLIGAAAPVADALTRDAQTKQNVRLLKTYIDGFAAARGFAFPAAAVVKKGGGLTAPAWPTNAWTGRAMAPGTARGAYTYTLGAGGGSFTLVGHLSSGSFTLTGGTPAWLTAERAAAASDLHNAQSAAASAEADAVTARAERDAALADAVAALADRDTAQDERAAALADLSQTQADLQASQADVAAVQADLAEAQDGIVTAEAARDAALAALATARDTATRSGLAMIQEILLNLAQGQGVLPAPATLTYSSLGSSWPAWPYSPFDGQRMAQGTDPGQFSYTPGADGSWTLVAHLTSGDFTLSQSAFGWAARKDQSTIVGATLIGYGLELDAVLHSGYYPGALSRDDLTTVDPWPSNQFTQQSMADGVAKGDFNYAQTFGGADYTLVANLTGGSTYDVAAWTRPLFEPLQRLRISLKDMAAQGYAQVLKDYAEQWKVEHDGALPSADQMSATGAVGAAHTWWPKNPWTMQPMTIGASTGQFEYAPGGDGAFTIVLHQQQLPMVNGDPSTAFPATYTAQ
jgi:hypothetical protein